MTENNNDFTNSGNEKRYDLLISEPPRKGKSIKLTERDLIDAMIEIIKSNEPLSCSTSQIRNDMYRKYNRYFPNGSKILRLLRRENMEHNNLIESRAGRDVYWRIK